MGDFLKKSYDYFKTLNLLSEAVSEIFEKSLNNLDFSANRITFLAEKSEIINNLKNDFITPLERGDIFFLAESLTEEMNYIFALNELLGLAKTDTKEELRSMATIFSLQNKIFFRLKYFKSNLNLFEQCHGVIKTLNADKVRIEKRIVDALHCKAEQPLVKYALYSSILNINRSVYITIIEIERILIENS